MWGAGGVSSQELGWWDLFSRMTRSGQTRGPGPHRPARAGSRCSLRDEPGDARALCTPPEARLLGPSRELALRICSAFESRSVWGACLCIANVLSVSRAKQELLLGPRDYASSGTLSPLILPVACLSLMDAARRPLSTPSISRACAVLGRKAHIPLRL